MAPSLASFSAFSSALTRSIVARNRFSSFGNSHRKSALSRTSCHKCTHKQVARVMVVTIDIAAKHRMLNRVCQTTLVSQFPKWHLHRFSHFCRGLTDVNNRNIDTMHTMWASKHAMLVTLANTQSRIVFGAVHNFHTDDRLTGRTFSP